MQQSDTIGHIFVPSGGQAPLWETKILSASRPFLFLTDMFRESLWNGSLFFLRNPMDRPNAQLQMFRVRTAREPKHDACTHSRQSVHE
jgi:hypothetical protein